jgi:hypothetical protein
LAWLSGAEATVAACSTFGMGKWSSFKNMIFHC